MATGVPQRKERGDDTGMIDSPWRRVHTMQAGHLRIFSYSGHSEKNAFVEQIE